LIKGWASGMTGGKVENMRNFSDKGIETAKERVSELMVRLGSLRPDTDTLTRDDIRGLLFYLRDYHDELIGMEYRRNIERAKRERKV
jgi:hypothetical protein